MPMKSVCVCVCARKLSTSTQSSAFGFQFYMWIYKYFISAQSWPPIRVRHRVPHTLSVCECVCVLGNQCANSP